MPYLMSEMGIKSSVINRIHYKTKEKMKKNKNLEFMWHQDWQNPKDGLFTHVLPGHYSGNQYCEPEQDCEIYIKSFVDSEDFIADSSNRLIEAIRIISSFFRHNYMFLPIGDDFSHANLDDLKILFSNYESIFEYINNRFEEFRINIQFGTLSDYFEAVESLDNVKYESKVGDFFTYADNENEYWSGYYTSRPSFKRKIRYTESVHRSAEIIYSFAKMIRNNIDSAYYYILEDARKEISLCQHHDAITGTSPDQTISDYYFRLNNTLDDVTSLLKSLTSVLLEKKTFDENILKLNINLIESQIVTSETKHILLMNSIAQWQQRVVKIKVDNENVVIKNEHGDLVEMDVSKIDNVYEVLFISSLPPLGIVVYDISFPFVNRLNSCVKDKIQPSLANDKIQLNFDSSGKMLNIKLLDSPKDFRLKHSMAYYRSSGGHYLFIPESKSEEMQISDFNCSCGKLYEQCTVRSSKDNFDVITKYTLYKGKMDYTDIIEVEHFLDMNKDNIDSFDNLEIFSLFQTDYENGVIHTDKNGLGSIKRRFDFRYPLAGQYYPMTVGAYIEDETSFFRIITSHPMGVASMASGQIEVCINRFLSQGDNRGVSDSLSEFGPLSVKYWIQFSLKKDKTDFFGDRETLMLNYPPLLFSIKQHWPASHNNIFSPLEQPFPENIHLQAFRARDESHNPQYIFRLVNQGSSKNESVNLKQIININTFPFQFTDIQEMSLSLLYTKKELDHLKQKKENPETSKTVKLEPYSIKTFLLKMERLNDNKNTLPSIYLLFIFIIILLFVLYGMTTFWRKRKFTKLSKYTV